MSFQILDKAGDIAFKRRYDGRSFFVGAIGVRKDGAIVHARNECAYSPNPAVHAEARLTRKLGYDAEIVYVARRCKGSKELGMAKPCPRCEAILRAHRVKRVIYSTGPNSWDSMLLV